MSEAEAKEFYAKIVQLQMERDFLKKLSRVGSAEVRRSLVDRADPLPVRRQCGVFSVSRGSVYYPPKGESEQNLASMRLMDAHIPEEPTAGVLTMQSTLRDKGYAIGYERVRRLMRKACISAIYPRRHLTVLRQAKYVHPYLLRELEINRPS